MFSALQVVAQKLLGPLGLLLIYFTGFWVLARALDLPSGVSTAFAAQLSPVLAVGVLLGLLAARRAKQSSGLSEAGQTPVAPVNLRRVSILLLIPLTPITQYLIANQARLPLAASLQVLLGAVILSGLLAFTIPRAVQKFSAPAPLMASGLAFTYLLFSMAGLSAEMAWFEQGNFLIQLALLAAAGMIFSIMLQPAARSFVLPFAVGFFLLNAGLHGWQYLQSERPAAAVAPARAPLFELTADQAPRHTPSIYLLVYDGYVAEETLAGYGLSNQDQESLLSALGFELFPQTYSIGAYTLATMTTVLDASQDYQSGSREAVSGNSQVHQALQAHGYTTYGLFSRDYFFIGTASRYDVAFPATRARTPAETLARSVLLGEFRFDLDFDSLAYSDFMEARQEAWSTAEDQPRFVYMHSPFPGHTQNSGVCQEDETEQFASRLDIANQEMRADIQAILTADPGAIIVIAGDHGPYLTKNCYETGGVYSRSEITRLDVQDRFGTFLAIRAPLADCELTGTIVVLQDLFPALFACLYQDPGLLAARVDPTIRYSPSIISRVIVRHGILDGGVHDGERLFESLP